MARGGYGTCNTPGQIENLVGVVMSRYDVDGERARRQVEEWAMTLED